MKVLIAPLNWGLGHASRCLALVIRYLRNGDEVVLAGDGDALTLLRKHFPNLRYYPLPPLQLTYSRGSRQVGAMLRNLPRLAIGMMRDHRALRTILRHETFDLVISDNRFGCWSDHARCAYITHQLTIPLPHRWQWAERLAAGLHYRIIRHYDECWVPDFADAPGLAGRLSHPAQLPRNVQYIGPLSRLEKNTQDTPSDYDVVAVLSGLEPQRTLLEQEIIKEWLGRNERVLVVQGKPSLPPMTIQKKNITIRPYISDAELVSALRHARTIISRSGYSSIMDYATLGLLPTGSSGASIRLIPTPGQPEQEYLATLHQ